MLFIISPLSFIKFKVIISFFFYKSQVYRINVQILLHNHLSNKCPIVFQAPKKKTYI